MFLIPRNQKKIKMKINRTWSLSGRIWTVGFGAVIVTGGYAWALRKGMAELVSLLRGALELLWLLL